MDALSSPRGERMRRSVCRPTEPSWLRISRGGGVTTGGLSRCIAIPLYDTSNKGGGRTMASVVTIFMGHMPLKIVIAHPFVMCR